MGRHSVLVVIAIILQILTIGSGDAAEEDWTRAGQAYSPDIVVVKLAQPASRGAGASGDPSRALSDLAAQFGPEISALSAHPNLDYWIGSTAPGVDVESLCRRLRGHVAVFDASPDYLASFAETIPNDPNFDLQYALRNIGQTYHPASGQSGTPGSDIGATLGWDVTTGAADVVVAVIDSGVTGAHEDLQGKTVAGYNFVNDTADASDDNGHGTFVASIAAAGSDNGLGMTGVSWGSRIMPVKVMAADGFGSYLAIAAGMRFAVDHGARVINLSISGSNPSFILEDACAYAYNMGVVIVAAVGNDGGWVGFPAGYDDYCVAVAATDANDERPQWSNYGPEVDIAAPGDLLLGARIDPADPTNLSAYDWASGTSFAAAHVAGAAALLMSLDPFLGNRAVMSLLTSSAADVNQSTHPGVDDLIGHGRLDIGSLLSIRAQRGVSSLAPIGRTILAVLIATLGVALIKRRGS